MHDAAGVADRKHVWLCLSEIQGLNIDPSLGSSPPSPLSLLTLPAHLALCITSSEEDLPKAAAVTEQTKVLISRKPLPLPVVWERGEKKRREGKK